MRYLIKVEESASGERRAILEFVKGRDSAKAIRSTITQSDHDIALLLVLIRQLQGAADELQPGLFNPLPPEEEATTADAMRITSLSYEMQASWQKVEVGQTEGSL